MSATSCGARREVVAAEDDHGQHDGQDADGLVLAREEGFRAFADGVGDGLHLGGAGIAGKHDLGENSCGNQRQQANADGDPEPEAV